MIVVGEAGVLRVEEKSPHQLSFGPRQGGKDPISFASGAQTTPIRNSKRQAETPASQQILVRCLPLVQQLMQDDAQRPNVDDL